VSLLLRSSFRFVKRRAIQPARSSRACRLETAAYFHTGLPYVAVNKDAFPTSPARVAGRIKSFRLPKQAQVSSVIHQAQYQAFVRFAVDSCAAFFLSHRAQKDPRFGTFSPGAGSRFENSGLDPYLPTGPATLD